MLEIFKSWAPLALSWFFMAMELPLISSAIARMPDSASNLASFGGIAFPIAMLIEAPIVMLLSASTALCVDYISYRKVYRFMMWAGAALTVFHILCTATPLYTILIRDVVGAPEELHELIRISLYCLIPWTWSIAHRRFHQGVLIRFGKTQSIGVGTFIRILCISAVLCCGFVFGGISGAAYGALAASCGVVAEAFFIYYRARPVIYGPLFEAPETSAHLTSRSFLSFYIPLSLTSILGFLTQPIGSAAMSRMPFALESLAVWPVVSGFSFLFRCWGFAFQEITVARLHKPGEFHRLYRFMLLISCGAGVPYLFIAISPLHDVIFSSLYGLNDRLSSFAAHSLIFLSVLPITSPIASFYQGILVQTRRTHHITQAIALFLGVTGALLLWGIASQRYPALFVTVSAISVAAIAQTFWLYLCAKRSLHRIVVKE